MVTFVLIGPEVGLRPVTCGPVTVSLALLLFGSLETPLAVVTIAVPAPSGVPGATVTLMLVSVQSDADARMACLLLKVTLPGDDPKFEPAMVTWVPPVAEAGVTLAMTGGATA